MTLAFALTVAVNALPTKAPLDCAPDDVPNAVHLRRDWVNSWRKSVRVYSAAGGTETEISLLQKRCPSQKDDIDWRDAAGRQLLRTDNLRGVSLGWGVTHVHNCANEQIAMCDGRASAAWGGWGQCVNVSALLSLRAPSFPPNRNSICSNT